jgi:hypothetical protein
LFFKGDEMDEPELLINISLRFPQLDRIALAEHLAPLVTEALKAGGVSMNISIQPYNPDEEE